MNGYDRYNNLNVKNKLKFNPKFLTSADIIRTDIKRLKIKQRGVKNQTSFNLRGYEHGIIKNQFVTFYFWCGGNGMSMKDMTKKQYKKYIHFRKLGGNYWYSINWKKDSLTDHFFNSMNSYINNRTFN